VSVHRHPQGQFGETDLRDDFVRLMEEADGGSFLLRELLLDQGNNLFLSD
jgi:hypothetical protein